MNDTKIKQIETRARLEHGGDFNKAAEAYFRDHPDYYGHSGVNKQAGEDSGYINRLVQTQIEKIASRDNLDLNKPADLAAATAKVFVEQPDLCKRQRAASTVNVGAKVSRD